MAAVTLFSGSIVNLKFKFAYVVGIPGVTQPESAATTTFLTEELMVVQTKSPLLLAVNLYARYKTKAPIRHIAMKRALVQNSLRCFFSTTCVSCLLTEQSTRPLCPSSPRLRQKATVAMCRLLKRVALSVRHRGQSKESVSKLLVTEPLLPEPANMQRKKAVVPTTKAI